MHDNFWMGVRYLLIAGGFYLAGRGVIPEHQVLPAIEVIMNLLPALVGALAAGWGFWARKGTVTVPAKAAEKLDAPTVNTATGTVTKGDNK